MVGTMINLQITFFLRISLSIISERKIVSQSLAILKYKRQTVKWSEAIVLKTVLAPKPSCSLKSTLTIASYYEYIFEQTNITSTLTVTVVIL